MAGEVLASFSVSRERANWQSHLRSPPITNFTITNHKLCRICSISAFISLGKRQNVLSVKTSLPTRNRQAGTTGPYPRGVRGFGRTVPHGHKVRSTGQNFIFCVLFVSGPCCTVFLSKPPFQQETDRQAPDQTGLGMLEGV